MENKPQKVKRICLRNPETNPKIENNPARPQKSKQKSTLGLRTAPLCLPCGPTLLHLEILRKRLFLKAFGGKTWQIHMQIFFVNAFASRHNAWFVEFTVHVDPPFGGPRSITTCLQTRLTLVLVLIAKKHRKTFFGVV